MADTVQANKGAVSSLADTDLVMCVASGGSYRPVSFADLARLVRGSIQIGGRNLIKGSHVVKQGTAYPIATYWFGQERPTEGDVYTVTVWGNFEDAGNKISAWNSGGNVKVFDLIKISDGIYRGSGKWVVKSAANTSLLIFQGNNAAGDKGNVTINKIKLERGNIATDWTPAPEDIASGAWGGG